MNAVQLRYMVAAAAAAVASIPTVAAALPAIAYDQAATETGFFNSTTYPNNTLYVTNSDGSSATYAGATASAAITPYSSASASASTGAMQFPYFGTFATPPYLQRLIHSAVSQIYYYFTVNGPSQEAVPLTAAFNLSVSASEVASTQDPPRGVAMGVIGGDLLSCVAYASTCYQFVSTNDPTHSYDPDVSFTILTGALGQVELYAEADTFQTSPGEISSASAYADPYIAIDPTWLAANPGYSLSFSLGVVNAGPGSPAAVPEPAAWSVMLVGFALAGGSMRRRRGNRLSFA